MATGSIYSNPRLFVSNYFSELINQIDLANQNLSTDAETDCYKKLIESVKHFEKESLQNIPVNHAEDDDTTQKYIFCKKSFIFLKKSTAQSLGLQLNSPIGTVLYLHDTYLKHRSIENLKYF